MSAARVVISAAHCHGRHEPKNFDWAVSEILVGIGTTDLSPDCSKYPLGRLALPEGVEPQTTWFEVTTWKPN